MRRFLLWACLLASASAALVLGVGSGAAAAVPGSAFVPPALLAEAQQNPTKLFEVIVQGAPNAGGSSAVAAVVRLEVANDRGTGVGLKRQFATVAGVSAELTGRQLVVLARMPGISTITADVPVRLTALSNNQQWPFVSGVARGWSNVTNGSLPKPPAIAVVDSGIDASRTDFAGRVVKQVTLTSLPGNSAGGDTGHERAVAAAVAGRVAR